MIARNGHLVHAPTRFTLAALSPGGAMLLVQSPAVR
jgi:hypothetical protein